MLTTIFRQNPAIPDKTDVRKIAHRFYRLMRVVRFLLNVQDMMKEDITTVTILTMFVGFLLLAIWGLFI